MALQLIGAGLGRTGTLTLKIALEQLGLGPCHHMTEVFANPGQVPFWNRAAAGEAVDWDEVYGVYRATVDWPGCHFWAQLAERYPDARVILSRRDPQRWYESISETILASLHDSGLAEPELPEGHPMWFAGKIIQHNTFGLDFSRENVIAAYEAHNAAVIAGIAPERLLVFEPSQGWEPLCAFLGVPVPAAAFPKSNSKEEFWELVNSAKQTRAM